MKLSRSLLCCGLLALGGCAEEEAPTAEDSNLLPDGATGVDRVVRHGETIELPWTAKDGMKYVADDFAIGPALVTTPYLATPDALGEWANNVVPFCIVSAADDSHFGLASADQTRLVDMLKDLEAITPLDFQRFGCNDATKPAKYVDYRYWDVTTSNQTVGGVGHNGWTIDLVHGFHNPDVWHETGHALGFMHEQQRSDRASFVNYYPSCVTPASQKGNFTQTTATNVSPYDIDSIMEYSSYSFATYNAAGTTILCPPILFGGSSPSTAPIWGTYNGTTLRGTLIGQSQEWSLEDINGAYTWYEPSLGANETNDMLGTAMVSADFDGDGYDDLAVGAMGEQPSSGHGGAVFLYKGTMNGLVAWMVLKESQFSGVATHSNDDFGMALAAGDVDGDGIADLAVGAPLAGNPQGGAVYVFQGGRGGPIPLGAPITPSTVGAGSSAAGDMFGTSIAIGKFYGGTKNYVAIGAPWRSIAGLNGSRGQVTIVGWNTLAFTSKETLDASDSGISIASGMFGYALAAGDMTRDGIDDLAVGAPAIGVGHGNVAMYYGHASFMTIAAPLSITGSWGTGDRFGYALAFAKTTGSEALAVGAPGRFGGGRAFMYLPFPSGSGYAPDEHMEYDQTLVAGQSNFSGDNFGASVAMADLDGDGNLDMMVGAPNKTVASQTGAGQVALFLTHVAAKVITNVTPTASDNFGHALAVGNFDRGDQSVVHNARTDFAVSSPYHDLGAATNAGVFGAYRGSTQALWRSFNQGTHNGP